MRRPTRCSREPPANRRRARRCWWRPSWSTHCCRSPCGSLPVRSCCSPRPWRHLQWPTLPNRVRWCSHRWWWCWHLHPRARSHPAWCCWRRSRRCHRPLRWKVHPTRWRPRRRSWSCRRWRRWPGRRRWTDSQSQWNSRRTQRHWNPWRCFPTPVHRRPNRRHWTASRLLRRTYPSRRRTGHLSVRRHRWKHSAHHWPGCYCQWPRRCRRC